MIELKISSNPRVPAPAAPFNHILPLQIRFNDIDLLGHVNNSVYVTFMDLGKAHYFNDVLGGLVDWHHINLAVVNININFYAPSFIESELCVVTTVTRISTHSLTLEQRIIDRSHGDEVKCIATTIMAGYDIATATSRALDKEWVHAIETFEGRKLRDIAPQ